MPHRDSPLSAASELATIVSTLMRSSLQPSSLPTYKRAWKLYNQFLHSTFHGVSMALPILPLIWHLLLPICLITIMLHQLFQLMYLHWAIPIGCLDFQTLLKNFLLSKCLKVTVNLEPTWIVGCQLLCQFYMESLQLRPDFHVQNIKSVSFKPCARLLSMPFLELVK